MLHVWGVLHPDWGCVSAGIEWAAVCFILSVFVAGWAYSSGALTSPKKAGKKESVTILHRFQFTSALKRMAVIVKVTHLLHGVLSSITRHAWFLTC